MVKYFIFQKNSFKGSRSKLSVFATLLFQFQVRNQNQNKIETKEEEAKIGGGEENTAFGIGSAAKGVISIVV